MPRDNFCNKCGARIDEDELYSLNAMSGIFAFGSKYDGDGFYITFCPECLDDLVESCAISPIIKEDDPSTWRLI